MTDSIYTLFLSICGGVDWNLPASVLFAMNTPLGMCFALYVAFVVLCVLNIVTGIFVDNANRLSAQDEDNMVVNRLATKKAWLEEVHELFLKADSEGCGTLTFENFRTFIMDVRVPILLGKLGVE